MIEALRTSDGCVNNCTGFIRSVFQDELILTKREFIERVMHPDNYWIMDEVKIRNRMKNFFSNTEILKNINGSSNERFIEDDDLSLNELKLLN